MRLGKHLPSDRAEGRNLRDEARAYAQDGLAHLARAFNHCSADDLAHRYSDAVQERFEALSLEIVRLVEYGVIEANLGHGRYLIGMAARKNQPLQSLIRKAERAARSHTNRRADQ